MNRIPATQNNSSLERLEVQSRENKKDRVTLIAKSRETKLISTLDKLMPAKVLCMQLLGI